MARRGSPGDKTVSRGASFSNGGEAGSPWRYSLWRVWDRSKPLLVMVMLNPSTANETANDPTVERCERRARADGRFGGLVVANIFAFRATRPKDMKATLDAIGPENDKHLHGLFNGTVLRKLSDSNIPHVFCAAWGAHGAHLDRGRQVRQMATSLGVRLHCLGVTKKGQPRHPLYLRYEEPIIELA